MNPVPPPPPAPDPEARLTALLLGELSPAEAAEVQAELARRPDWLDLFTRLARTLPLVREAVREPGLSAPPVEAGVEPVTPAPDTLRLSPERREALLAAFKTVAPSRGFAARPAARQTHWLALAAIVVGLLVVGGGMLLPSLGKAKAKAQRVSQLAREREAELEQRLAELDARTNPPPPAAAVRLFEALDDSPRRKPEPEPNAGRPLARSTAAGTTGPVTLAKRTVAPSTLGASAEGTTNFPGRSDTSEGRILLRYGLMPGPARPEAETGESSPTAREPQEVAAPELGDQPQLGLALKSVPPASAAVPRLARAAEAAKELVPPQPAAPAAARDFFAPAAEVAGRLEQGGLAGSALDRAQVSPGGERLERLAVPMPVAPLQADLPLAQDALSLPGTSRPVPLPEVATADERFSTFSLNVSDVSFRLAAASLEAGHLPDPNTVRVEEFINAFDYRDPAPAPGAPLAFHWERARHPFAHNRELVRLSVRTAAQGREPGRALNLVLVLDRSGSMERADRVATCREMLRVLAAQLTPEDRLSVVTFARTARLFAEGLQGHQAGPVLEDAAAVTPEGGTNLEDALRLGYATAARHFLPGGVNRVILITDGAANLGVVMPESLQQLVEENRRRGVALDCFGVGSEDYNDELLERLARHGDGRYGFLNAPEEAATGFAAQLAGALRVAAADVKVQVEFNPARVTRWRLIGYAQHRLTTEQFRDPTVDAAEIGAAEAGNALYVLEVNPQGQGPLGVFRVRFREPATGRYHEQEWTLPWSGAAPEAVVASPAMRLALTAALFGEWLAQSPYAAEVSPDALLRLHEGVPGAFADPRPRQLEQMLQQARALAGR